MEVFVAMRRFLLSNAALFQRINHQFPPRQGIFFDGQVFDARWFLCIDDIVYHLGASLKDLGRKWFAFSRMEVATERLLEAVGAGERGVAGQ